MEEAPTPSKPQINNEPKGEIEHIKKFEANYKENNKFEISIYKIGSYLFISTDIPKGSQKIKYSNYYDIDTLKQNNKFLALCDSIDDIIDTIYDNASNFSCNINENYNDYEIKIPVPVKNIKEISFLLKEKKKTQTEIINDFIQKCNLQEKKINELEIRMQNFETSNKKINELEMKIKNLETENKKINDLEKRIKHLEEENKKFKNDLKEILKKELIDELKSNKEKNSIKIINPILNSKSKIINYNLFQQLNNWINPNKPLQFQLIFTASINGDSFVKFHDICNGKGPTVTIVKGKNGHIFGGYVTVPFSSDEKPHYDENAFLFSLTNLKKFPIKIKEQAVYHLDSWGPYIGFLNKCDLAIDSGCLRNKDSYSEPNSYDFNRIDLIGQEEKKFGIEDYEVYLVV